MRATHLFIIQRPYTPKHILNPCGQADGRILAKHRKVHLFDIDVPGRITFRESDTLTGGGSITVVDCPFAGGFKLGVGICYDIRFPEVRKKNTERVNGGRVGA